MLFALVLSTHVAAMTLHADHDGPAKELSLVAKYLKGTTTRKALFQHAESMSNSMSVKESLQKLHSKLPLPVIAMLESKGKQEPSFDQDALDRARETLNGMIETAQAEYDLKDMECKAFEERNREEYRQTESDLSRLGSALAKDAAKITEATASINEAAMVIGHQEEVRDANDDACMTTKLENEASLQIMKNDLAIAEFIVKMTACTEAGLLQGHAFLKEEPQIEKCPLEGGKVMLSFKGGLLSAKANQLGSDVAKKALREALAKSHPNMVHDELALLAQEPAADAAAAKTKEAPVADPMMKGGMAAKEVPAAEGPDESKAANKCVLGKPDCGRLNDNMALMWGAVKDQVDELTSIMNDNALTCVNTRNMHNAEISTWQSLQSKKNTELSDATGSKNQNSEEQTESESEKLMLTAEYDKVFGECEEILHEILFTDICGVKNVRGEIAKFSTTYGPTDILDCEVTDWIPTECTISCVDTSICEGLPAGKMPPPECYGGVQDMERNVVQNKTYGADCPALKLEKGCNAFPCPTHCEMTSWSAFGACSKECGGGVKARTRNIGVRAANGGESCPEDTDMQQCNTQSCDIDCVLHEWTPWSPCSRACIGGTQERARHVDSPHEGLGTCEEEKSEERWETKGCNEFECPPDSTCEAKQDIVLVVDVSGSLRETGFATMIKMVKSFTNLYEFGENYTKMGIVEYSIEGKIVSPLVDNKDDVDAAADRIAFQRGVTDMASGITMAQTVLMEGRKTAQSVVIVFTDAKPSFRFATESAAKSIRDKGARLVFVPIIKYDDPSFVKSLASDPKVDNVVIIEGGLKALANKAAEEAETLMTATCSQLRVPEVVEEIPAKSILAHVYGAERKQRHFRGGH